MRAIHIIPPVVALVAVVVWNTTCWRAVSAQTADSRDLRERVERARSAGVSGKAGAGGEGRSQRVRTLLEGGAMDWRDLAERMVAMENGRGHGDIRAMIGLQKRLSEMSSDDLVAALGEIQALGLEPDATATLEAMLVDPLIEKDPQLALETFAGRIRDDEDGVGSQLSAALGAWAKKDPGAASAWLDRQIAAGLFESKSLDGVSQPRMEYEAALVGELLNSDVGAAAGRIAALPEEQRREALEQIFFSELSPAGQKAYAGLVRGLVPQDERDGSFSHVISELVPDGGYPKVAEFLDGIQATPEERAVSARQAANSQLEEIAGERAVTREDVDAMREWLNRQAPGTADKVTGESLGDAAQEGGEFGFEEASKLALEYHRSAGNDDVLVAFLESFAARSNLEQALPLAEMIADPERRKKILSELK